MEQWKALKQFPEYAISSYGKLKRLKPSKNKGHFAQVGFISRGHLNPRWGYLSFSFRRPGGHGYCWKKVHRLVYETFVGPIPLGKEINHIDGNKINNRLDNLETVTRQENIKHSYRLGLSYTNGSRCHLSKLNERIVLKIKKWLFINRRTNRSIARELGLHYETIGQIKRNMTWKHVLFPPQSQWLLSLRSSHPSTS